MVKQLYKIVSDRSVSLTQFVGQVGECLYGSPLQIGKHSRERQFAYEQTIAILAQNPKLASVRLHVKSFVTSGPYGFKDLRPFEYMIAEKYWLSEFVSYEEFQPASGLRIHEAFLIPHDAWAEYLRPSEFQRVHISIKSPEKLLRSAVRLLPLPDKNSLQLYTKYEYEITKEAIAAAWRYICINSSIKEYGLVAELERVMRGYMTAQQIHPDNQPKHATLIQIARRIADQLERKDVNSSVLVSGNPGAPIR